MATGGEHATLPLKPGYWRWRLDLPELRRCPGELPSLLEVSNSSALEQLRKHRAALSTRVATGDAAWIHLAFTLDTRSTCGCVLRLLSTACSTFGAQ